MLQGRLINLGLIYDSMFLLMKFEVKQYLSIAVLVLVRSNGSIFGSIQV